MEKSPHYAAVRMMRSRPENSCWKHSAQLCLPYSPGVLKSWGDHVLRRFSIDSHFPTEQVQKSRWLRLRGLRHST